MKIFTKRIDKSEYIPYNTDSEVNFFITSEIIPHIFPKIKAFGMKHHEADLLGTGKNGGDNMPNKTKDKKLTAFGKKVKKRLIDLDMEQGELAKLVGMSSAYLCYILYGEVSGEKWIPRIWDALEQCAQEYDERRRA